MSVNAYFFKHPKLKTNTTIKYTGMQYTLR